MLGLVTLNKLRQFGVVGMNARNHSVIQALNLRHLYPLVDDKLLTKWQARRHGVDVPQLIGVIRYQRQVHDLGPFLTGLTALSSSQRRVLAAKGILVIVGRDGDYFIKPSGEKLQLHALVQHVNNCLSGLYSLGGRPDAAMFEHLINFTDAFEGFSYQGVPDVRIIVCKGYPILAMMRLSTAASDGKPTSTKAPLGLAST